MRRSIRILAFLFFIAIFLAGVFWFFEKFQEKEAVKDVEITENIGKVEAIQNVQINKDAEKNQIVENVLDVQNEKNTILNVPFVLQAPFGNWSDPLFEDACEEAAILMASGWIKNKGFTSQEAYDEIKKIAKLEEKFLGEHIDASAGDTAEILKKYADHEAVDILEKISVKDIVLEISRGNLVIVPTNGRKLGNPFYTPPGPITHMVVIVGYDSIKGEFITNDSGTRKGKNYRYAEEILFEAIRDYPTGNHYENPISETSPSKVMIVVKKA